MLWLAIDLQRTSNCVEDHLNYMALEVDM